nr:TonB-dependent receptor plug domain-containing protein [Flammeovirgaceae bacterium]
VMGEADIMKIALTLPGVQTVGEGASGFNVRGGGTDQNLILINDVPIYNTNHLFGFFSAFNPEVISSANLYKSGIQANYGGRISSVFDVALRDGNKKDFSIKGGISPITGKVTIEGPLKKDTSSFVLGVRSTYSDYIFSLLDDPNLRNSQASFSDFITKFNFKLDEKNTLILSGYHSRDNFSLNSDSVYQYYNSNAAIQWRHNFNNKLYLVTSGSYANYSYNLTSDQVPINAFEMDYEINHTNFKSEVNYFPNSKNNFRMGITSTLYNLNPGQGRALGDSSLVTEVLLDRENGLESAIYFGNEFEVNPRLSIYAGIRLSMFNLIGPGKSYVYQPGSPLEPEFIADTLNYSKGEMIKTYAGPEYRFSARQKLKDDLSVKFSYDRTRQYIHMLSNSVSISPTDTWRLSNAHIRPQIGDQVSLGLYKTVFGKGIEISLEGYYKQIQNVLEYKDGASLLLNEVLETDVINSEGKAYGVEFMIKRDIGKVSGWLSYTYARSFVQANGAYPVEQINQGEFYPSNFDKPHNLVIISNYKFNRRVNLSLNINYSTGRPATFPASKYTFNNQPILLYTERNQYRVPDYFRMDLAVNFEGNHKVKKRVHGSWSFSVYNLTGRSNAYSVYFLSEGGNINGYQLSVFANPIPTITYNFHYR